jgi:hypothetical protein
MSDRSTDPTAEPRLRPVRRAESSDQTSTKWTELAATLDRHNGERLLILLIGYPDDLLNPYSVQWTFGVQRNLGRGWVLSADYVGSHTVHVVRPLDVDPPTPFVRTAQGQTQSAQAANCTRPLWAAFYAAMGRTCNTSTANPPQPAYSVIQTDVNDGYVR